MRDKGLKVLVACLLLTVISFLKCRSGIQSCVELDTTDMIAAFGEKILRILAETRQSVWLPVH